MTSEQTPASETAEGLSHRRSGFAFFTKGKHETAPVRTERLEQSNLGTLISEIYLSRSKSHGENTVAIPKE